jgi:hypothetical protein
LGIWNQLREVKEIEVERVVLGGLKIDAVEDSLVVADIVHGVELGAVEEAARAVRIDDDEVAQFGSAEAERRLLADAAEGTVIGVELSERLFPEARTGSRLPPPGWSYRRIARRPTR